MSLEVKYFDSPPGAQKDMTVTATRANSMSDLSKIATGDQSGPWATLEQFGWPLDGSRQILPDVPNIGFWSTDISYGTTGILGQGQLGNFQLGIFQEPASFTASPVIEILFSEKYTATGMTFTFSPNTNEWCSEMYVEWYNGEILLDGLYAYPDAPRWTLVRKVESFDRIQVSLLKTNKPGAFAKVQMIEIGQTIIFRKDELISVNLVNEIDPTLSDLSVDTMTIEIQDKQGRSLAPQENQKMELHRITDEGSVLIASHYITESSRQAKRSYSFSCQSAVGLLEDTFLGGMYVDTALDTVVANILDGRDYDLGPFTEAKISGYLPVCTRREALQQVAFAIGAVISTQGTDIIRFLALPDGDPTGYFERDRIFTGGSVETAPRVYKVEAVAHSYVKTDEIDTLINNEEFSGESILLTFDDPHHAYAITGGKIVESGVNYVIISATGNVTLTAKTYVHSTVRRSAVNSLATASERNNVQTIENATLIHSGNVESILARMLQFANMRQTLTQSAVIEGQHAGQKVRADDPWGGLVTGYVTSLDSNLTQNGHTASVTIIGVRTEA